MLLTKRLPILLTLANLIIAQTPPGFTPAVSNHLQVIYSNGEVNPGVTEPGEVVASAPTLGASGAAADALYFVLMLDLSVNLPGSTSNTTLLHWALADLQLSNNKLLSQRPQDAPYFPPGPPAAQTHTYVFEVYRQPKTLTIPDEYVAFFSNITTDVTNRIGFNATKFAAATGLENPVAANYFLVRTPPSCYLE
ncbi:PEBP-like protein [Thozetella sp. PMI_491]|nr:PEBP-like protein [Thozetella sp. PMI_491]